MKENTRFSSAFEIFSTFIAAILLSRLIHPQIHGGRPLRISIPFIALAGALLTSACTGLLHKGDGIPVHGKPVGASPVAKPLTDATPQPWRLTVSQVDRTLGGGAWRGAGVRHVLSRYRAAWDAGGEAAVVAAAGVTVSGADTGPADGRGNLIPASPQPLPTVLSAPDKLARAWRRYCDAGEGMSNEDYELVIDGAIPEGLRVGCRPPK